MTLNDEILNHKPSLSEKHNVLMHKLYDKLEMYLDADYHSTDIKNITTAITLLK